ncbi:hypothetical protein DPSP01_009747 [Paraphaeosphaeria sporulosa]
MARGPGLLRGKNRRRKRKAERKYQRALPKSCEEPELPFTSETAAAGVIGSVSLGLAMLWWFARQQQKIVGTQDQCGLNFLSTGLTRAQDTSAYTTAPPFYNYVITSTCHSSLSITFTSKAHGFFRHAQTRISKSDNCNHSTLRFTMSTSKALSELRNLSPPDHDPKHSTNPSKIASVLSHKALSTAGKTRLPLLPSSNALLYPTPAATGKPDRETTFATGARPTGRKASE